MLRIQINSQDTLALFMDKRTDIDGGGGLSNPTLARDKRDDFTHHCYLHFRTVFEVVQTMFSAVFAGTMYLTGGECAVIRLQKPLILLDFSLNPIRIRVPKILNANAFGIFPFYLFTFVKRSTACSGSGHRFESYIVHQKKKSSQPGWLFSFGTVFRYRTRTGRRSQTETKCPVDTWLGRGRVLWISECR